MVQNHRLVWLQCLLLAAAAPLTAGSAASYDFITIDPPEGANYTDLRGINERGEIVGFTFLAGGGGYGFVIREGVFTRIGYPGTNINYPTGINARGQIAGVHEDLLQPCCGWILTKERYELLSTPSGARTAAVGMNDRGDAVGLDQYWVKGRMTEIGYPGAPIRVYAA